MSFQAECPHCSIRFEAKSHLAGKTVRCPQCKEPFKIEAPAGSSSEADIIPVAKVASATPKKKPTPAPKKSPPAKKKPAPATVPATPKSSADDLLMEIKEPSASRKQGTPLPAKKKPQPSQSRGSMSAEKSLDELLAEGQSASEKKKQVKQAPASQPAATATPTTAPATVSPTTVNGSLPAIILPRKEHVSAKQPQHNTQAPSQTKPAEARVEVPAKVDEKAEPPKSKSLMIDLDAQLAEAKKSPAAASQTQDSAGQSSSNENLDLKEKLRPAATSSTKKSGNSQSGTAILERDEEDLRLDDEELKLENWTSLVTQPDASASQPPPQLEKEDSRVFPVSEVNWDAAADSPSGLAEIGDSKTNIQATPPKKSDSRPIESQPPKKSPSTKKSQSASGSKLQGLSSSNLSSSGLSSSNSDLSLSGNVSKSAAKIPTAVARPPSASLIGVDPIAAHKIKAAARQMTGGDPTLEEITAVGGTESIVQLSQALQKVPPPQPFVGDERKSFRDFLPESLSKLPPTVLYGAIGGGVLLVLIIGVMMASGGSGSSFPTDPNFQPTSERATGFSNEFLDPSGLISVKFPTSFEKIVEIDREFQGGHTLNGAKELTANDAYFMMYTDSLPGTSPDEKSEPTEQQWDVFGLKEMSSNPAAIQESLRYDIGPQYEVFEYALDVDIIRSRYGKSRMIVFFTERRMFLLLWSGLEETAEVDQFFDSLTLQDHSRGEAHE